MRAVLDAFWRALAYCLHWRVILWSLLPLLVAGGSVGALGWFYWESTLAAVRSALEQWSLVAALLHWLDGVGLQAMHALLAPMIVVALAVPAIVLLTLLLVALWVTPAVVSLVAQRRFPALEARHGGGWLQSLGWSLACTAAALVALVLSIPLWFVPPLVLVLPPLIWGWLTCRILAFDVLSVHASAAERRQLLHARRWPLLLMGVVAGYLGALPSLLWALSAATLIFAPILVLASVWLYTLVFAFAACWFAHYALAELQGLRGTRVAPRLEPEPEKIGA
ncbi:MAG: EI24 domain-containing protein [Burkholderiales bacterium]|nr:EI24 domain-containing protein [Burkholderiales bacterium]MDE1928873.1 EI24 domain-containing protein [Burkholderiales bacterium]MDE2160216.1 EI24 domain-containing protein [Burkholderiales bacterium]MDE2503306.1 EI24 domain-containing protein [Burkholderiales bacterium]